MRYARRAIATRSMRSKIFPMAGTNNAIRTTATINPPAIQYEDFILNLRLLLD